MKAELVNINKVRTNPNNPRIIKDDKFQKLVKSIQEFPQMLEIRPIVVNEEMIVLGGNMRLKACQEAGLKKVHIIKASDLTEEQQKEFIIKDNVGFGEWDWDNLANEWDSEKLEEWGLDIPFNDNSLPLDEIKEQEDLDTVVVVAAKNINDLDRLTDLYNLQSIEITEDIKNQIMKERKVYVFK